MACNQASQIHRYHDGELQLTERELVSVHLRECSECRELAQELTALSRLLLRAEHTETPPDLVIVLRRQSDLVRNRAVIRIAGWLTAAAAAVLVGALLNSPTSQRETGAALGPLDALAVVSPIQARDDWAAMAAWMAEDLASAGNGDMR